MKKILHVVQIKVPRSVVYEALTTEKGLSGWWSTQVKAHGGVGETVDFTFLAGFNPNMKITLLEEDARVGWECVGGHENWLHNTFTFDLSDGEGTTQLIFTQIYARELDDVAYGTYNYNWGYYLDSLRAYLEDGAGKPFQVESRE